MYQKILVPLDGSELAECVLPHVETMAKGCVMKEVVFVRVIESVQLPPIGDGSIGEEEMNEMRIEDETSVANYLEGVRSRVSLERVASSAEILKGKPAETLADFASKNGFGLIIMSTHGRSGVSRWVFGSTADRVLRSACVPVLMVRAPGCVPEF